SASASTVPGRGIEFGSSTTNSGGMGRRRLYEANSHKSGARSSPRTHLMVHETSRTRSRKPEAHSLLLSVRHPHRFPELGQLGRLRVYLINDVLSCSCV